MMKSLGVAFVISSILTSAFWQRNITRPTGAAVATKSAVEPRRAILAWLECEECGDGELEAVVKLGSLAVPSLATSLREGPSQAKRELRWRELINSHDRVGAYYMKHRKLIVPMSQQTFVRAYLDNYVALYQKRAAIGLAAIGGRDASKALEDAERAALRNDVRKTVEASIDKLRKRE
jgi:hypothetical protein